MVNDYSEGTALAHWRGKYGLLKMEERCATTSNVTGAERGSGYRYSFDDNHGDTGTTLLLNSGQPLSEHERDDWGELIMSGAHAVPALTCKPAICYLRKHSRIF